ncbi:MAG: UPF0147 family protein [Candidatus Micrarchaeota archaeon]|nr:UPF0147 family protein [Candidatus Micrarchaeota archaeon]
MKDEKEIAELINQATQRMDMVINDLSVPKNVRGAVSEAKSKLSAQGDYTVRVSSAIYKLDEVTNDINLPPQARTMIWNILSMLESIRE